MLLLLQELESELVNHLLNLVIDLAKIVRFLFLVSFTFFLSSWLKIHVLFFDQFVQEVNFTIDLSVELFRKFLLSVHLLDEKLVQGIQSVLVFAVIQLSFDEVFLLKKFFVQDISFLQGAFEITSHGIYCLSSLLNFSCMFLDEVAVLSIQFGIGFLELCVLLLLVGKLLTKLSQ